MLVFAMTLPPDDGGFRAGGLPIGLLAKDAIRRARAGLAQREPMPAAAPDVPAMAPQEHAPLAEASAAPLIPVALVSADPSALSRTLRGFTLIDLYVEARRAAAEAAVNVEHLEGLAAGRTYGAPGLQPGFATPECYRRTVADAKRQAEMAGATADFLRGILGHEAALTSLLDDGR
jgi:hypothetical protein